MFKRFGRLSVGALLAASLIGHIPVAKAEMSTGKFIKIIESEGKVSAELTKEFVMKGFLASTYIGLRWANLMLKNLKRQPLFCVPAGKSQTANDNYKLLKRDFNLLGDIYLDINYKDIAYISDTGRNWNTNKYNIRENIPEHFCS